MRSVLSLYEYFRRLLQARGLDNAGKTTIVKRIMNEDVTTVRPSGLLSRPLTLKSEFRYILTLPSGLLTALKLQAKYM